MWLPKLFFWVTKAVFSVLNPFIVASKVFFGMLKVDFGSFKSVFHYANNVFCVPMAFGDLNSNFWIAKSVFRDQKCFLGVCKVRFEALKVIV